jgi:small-conductance mechanosensitive channel
MTTQISGCPLTQLGVSGVVLSLDVWCADARGAILLRCDLQEQAKKRFAAEGIRIPLPQTSLVLKDDRRPG